MAVNKAKKSVKKTAVKKPTAKVTTVKATTKVVAKKKTSFAANSKSVFAKVKAFTSKNTDVISVLVAEFIGTFLFVAVYMCVPGNPLYAMFALVGIALIIGNISGAAINPAMTIGAWITKKIGILHAIGYLIAQVLGATAAWTVLSAYSKGLSGATATLFQATALTAGKEWFIFFAELIGAAILAFGLGAALKMKNDKTASSFTYGFALFIAMIITIILISPLGTSMVFFNPAISFVANAITWNVWPIAIYVVAPIIGAVTGFVLYEVMQPKVLNKK